ncbi:hypothetical protein EMIHUDRAFT_207352 [Emiliania huxleyi CCMP1516]|uniref:Phosphoglycerate mutase n=2 Tax=Emiliania huxleyi TaxID=2903 RepID=A0A0D3JFC2_EMIH1|nr:hypothetical protein EMIHUDRAFT_207352 [Emiliania huxleyi CCMP1516]EOD22207.1 hypothetical protein EMIHUDRAFT_207352 [Emiliania huxleyi CCMP1516]|eukprot:XP_005774636.1 hypothetical protein EMIHUDRAFT_207352 [Emiliania huxleyi CCMP1516]
MEGNEPDPQLPAKRIFFVRHGEGEHNLGGHASSGYLIADAVLTAAGQVQCRSICSALSSPPPQLVVVSPLRRTMHTAMLAFGNTAPFLLLPSIMETGLMPCDCPQPAAGAAMLEEVGWPGLARQYAALGEGWDTKGPGWRASVLERFAALIELLGAREEERIAVVSHHDFLKANLGISFEPAELRAFSLCAGGLLDELDGLHALHVARLAGLARATKVGLSVAASTNEADDRLARSAHGGSLHRDLDAVGRRSAPSSTHGGIAFGADAMARIAPPPAAVSLTLRVDVGGTADSGHKGATPAPGSGSPPPSSPSPSSLGSTTKASSPLGRRSCIAPALPPHCE